MLLAILAVKIISMAVTSGRRGGFVIPLFFAGATLGLIIHHLLPNISLPLTIISCMATVNSDYWTKLTKAMEGLLGECENQQDIFASLLERFKVKLPKAQKARVKTLLIVMSGIIVKESMNLSKIKNQVGTITGKTATLANSCCRRLTPSSS